ncbi:MULTISPECIES: hypothetical protein [unclassified Streptomyces]|uniref:hypothetical protein n=1 Tax=unclassified Streptomyces TaxID=2593676 RepID=UPI0022B7469B|nr:MULTISPECIES: hypothetical protein [unclassified Streptomyces]MCZ7416373.1 hypothetical protein [Streptomyces sp. WMMC897]MCZ7433817.1 hypothetical protein [Streptomyces sp. WMMC1477]
MGLLSAPEETTMYEDFLAHEARTRIDRLRAEAAQQRLADVVRRDASDDGRRREGPWHRGRWVKAA